MYDGTDSAVISGAILTGVVGTEDVTLTDDTTGTFAQIDAGTGIVVSTSMTLNGQDIDNYELAELSDITADILVKDLTVAADDKEREACSPNPELSITYSGFAGAEDASVLDTEPTVSVSADETSVPGTYDIIVSGGSDVNYNLIYVTGTLTISPDITEPELEVRSLNIQLNESGFAIVTPADVVVDASDICGLKDTLLSQSIFTSDDIGDVSIDVSVSDMAGNTTTKSTIITVEGSTGFEVQEGFAVRFFPNPVSDHLTIETGISDFTHIEIASLNGQVVLSTDMQGPTHRVDLSAFRKGAYFITIKSKDFVGTWKIIKQ